YDAPIGESGNITPKYHEVRNLLKNYLPQGETLPEIPDSIPTIVIPEIRFEEIAYVFDNLLEPKQSEHIRSMEFFDQGWGSILYRTKLPGSLEPQKLKVSEVHDWAQVFINGERIGVLNRLRGDAVVTLPPVEEGAQLDILVEAMGRQNFGKGIYDWKGITEKVELISEESTVELKNWEVFSIPVDHEFAKNKDYKKQNLKANQPAYYRATFSLDKAGDTFIDMMNWKKGMVYVNGYNIGRFWEIGPQQTLYMPGCWLKKGENEIIILDMSGPDIPTIQGLHTPILDVQRGSGAYKHRKASENLDLSDEKPVYKGSFKPGHGWQTVKFNQSYTTRYFCLEALSSQKGDPYASIAELEILGPDGEKLSRQHWKVIYADSEEADAANNVASNIFDLQESTIWHTSFSSIQDPYPHQLVIDLGEEKEVSGFQYLPRMEADKPAMIKDYQIFLKKTPFKL
ncbi:MAG: discoidin domain-containing protein, partial [Tannerella sp.]|nr:discoidin domain-containing protein [Tannerella sp.]